MQTDSQQYDALNIATMPIADKVRRHIMASYYAVQLDVLQTEAKRLGYFFAQADKAATMPPTLADCLARAVMHRRESYLCPEAPEVWEPRTDAAMREGYGPEILRSMLAALDALGIRLQESPQAAALLAAQKWPTRELHKTSDGVVGASILPYFADLHGKDGLAVIDEQDEDKPA